MNKEKEGSLLLGLVALLTVVIIVAVVGMNALSDASTSDESN